MTLESVQSLFEKGYIANMRQNDIAYAINQFLINKDSSILENEVDLLVKEYGYTKDDVLDEFYFTAHKWFGDDASIAVEREVQEILG